MGHFRNLDLSDHFLNIYQFYTKALLSHNVRCFHGKIAIMRVNFSFLTLWSSLLFFSEAPIASEPLLICPLSPNVNVVILKISSDKHVDITQRKQYIMFHKYVNLTIFLVKSISIQIIPENLQKSMDAIRQPFSPDIQRFQ